MKWNIDKEIHLSNKARIVLFVLLFIFWWYLFNFITSFIFTSISFIIWFLISKRNRENKQEEKTNANMKNKTTKTTWVISGIIILFIITVVIVGGSGSNNYSSQTPKKINTNDIGDKIDIHVEAQQFVLQRLKAPATAKFPALPYEAIDLGNDRYKIMSFVDSQNSFGALIRSDWTVVMKTTNNSWVLERMIVGGEVVYDPIQEKKDYEEIKKINTENDARIDQVLQQIDQQQQLLKSLQQ